MTVTGPYEYKVKYFGLSTDTKPTPVVPGAGFYETDTKETYIFTGDSWAQHLVTSSILDSYGNPIISTNPLAVKISDGTNVADIHANAHTVHNELLVLFENHVCTDNTTTTILNAGQAFTGGWQEHLNYQEINISIDTDQDSAVNGLVIQWSADGTTVADSDMFNVYANAGTNYTPNPAFMYVRVVYTNGAVDQTRFNLMTILRKSVTGGSFHRVDSTLRDDSDGRLTLSIPKLRTAQDTYISGSATNSGNYKISLEELESGVSSNSNSQLNTTLFASDGNELCLDEITGAICSVDYSHHEIHFGNHFYHKDWTDLANGATYDILVSVADSTKWPHFLFILDAEAEFNMILYAGVTTSNDGTALLANNRNGNSATTNDLLIYHTPTITNLGTQIARYKGGSGKQIGGSVRANNEQILTQNTKFLARIHNDTTSNNWVDFLLDWYEHTNR